MVINHNEKILTVSKDELLIPEKGFKKSNLDLSKNIYYFLTGPANPKSSEVSVNLKCKVANEYLKDLDISEYKIVEYIR